MALVDDESLKQVTKDEYVLLLEGKGIITNMSEFNKKLKFRYDTDIPGAISVAARVLNGSDNDEKLSFVNEDENSKIYGIAKKEDVYILVTREV